MSKSSKAQSGKGSLVNGRRVQVVVTRRDGKEFALGGRARLDGVREEDYPNLPDGVTFVPGN